MIQLLEKIDKYLVIQERNEEISMSLKPDPELKDIIEMVRKSDDVDRTISMFSEDMREKIKKLIDGGIL